MIESASADLSRACIDLNHARAVLRQPHNRSRLAAPFFRLQQRWNLYRCQKRYTQAYKSSIVKKGEMRAFILKRNQLHTSESRNHVRFYVNEHGHGIVTVTSVALKRP